MKLVQRVVVIWLVCFCIFWIPKACKADMFTPSWQQEFAEEIYTAFIEYEQAIQNDSTDFGCQVAEINLKNRIELILYQHADAIRKEVDLDNDRKELEELHARDEEIMRQDRLLDERAAWQDARQFND